MGRKESNQTNKNDFAEIVTKVTLYKIAKIYIWYGEKHGHHNFPQITFICFFPIILNIA